jgi:transcriptional regulator with XRE-family HTH domain
MSEPNADGTYDLYIGGHLDDLITASGMKDDEVAAKAGISYSHLRAVARGERPVTVKTAQRIAKALGVSLVIVLGEVAARPIPSGRILQSGELMSIEGQPPTIPGYFVADATIPGVCTPGALVQVLRSPQWITGRHLAIQYGDGRIRVRQAVERDGDRWLVDELGDEARYNEARHTVIGRVARTVNDFEG